MGIVFAVIIVVIVIVGIFKIFPVHQWIAAQFMGMDIGFGDFLQLKSRCGDPLDVIKSYLLLKKSDIHTISLDDLAVVCHMNGKTGPFVYGYLSFKTGSMPNLDPQLALNIFLNFGSEFKDIIMRSRHETEMITPSFTASTRDRAQYRIIIKMNFCLNLEQIAGSGDYSSDELLRKILEKITRIELEKYADINEISQKKNEILSNISQIIENKSGILIKSIKFLTFQPTGEKSKRLGMTIDLYDQLEDDILLEDQMAKDDEINQLKMKRNQ